MANIDSFGHRKPRCQPVPPVRNAAVRGVSLTNPPVQSLRVGREAPGIGAATEGHTAVVLSFFIQSSSKFDFPPPSFSQCASKEWVALSGGSINGPLVSSSFPTRLQSFIHFPPLSSSVAVSLSVTRQMKALCQICLADYISKRNKPNSPFAPLCGIPLEPSSGIFG